MYTAPVIRSITEFALCGNVLEEIGLAMNSRWRRFATSCTTMWFICWVFLAGSLLSGSMSAGCGLSFLFGVGAVVAIVGVWYNFFAWAPLQLRGDLVAVLCFQCGLRRTRCVVGCACFRQIRVLWRLVCCLRPPLEFLALVDVVSLLEVANVPGGSLFKGKCWRGGQVWRP